MRIAISQNCAASYLVNEGSGGCVIGGLISGDQTNEKGSIGGADDTSGIGNGWTAGEQLGQGSRSHWRSRHGNNADLLAGGLRGIIKH